MISVEQVLAQNLPQLSNKPWLYKPVKGALRRLLHEQDFIAFASRYPHLQGLEFVEQVLDYFNFRYSVRDNEIERIPATGLIILRDGKPGDPEVTLSPLRYHYQHRAELEVVVQAPNGRASAFDTLIAAIGIALEADRTLGGLCDWVEPEAPASVDLPIEGAAALKAAVITVVLHYTTTGPLA